MEKELNIAAILKNKPQNTRLWSPIFGDVYLKDVTDVNNNMIRITHHGVDNIFMNNGKVWADGDVCLFPSSWMNDWQKFAWKKGDVLVSNDGKREVLFKTWERDSYTKFVGLHCLISNDNEEVEYDNGTTVFNTNDFKGIEAEDVAQSYINTVEERLGGKLNLETLEIEEYPEFKDGDILHCDETDYSVENIFIAKMHGEAIGSYAFLCLHNNKLNIADCDCDESELPAIRLATDSEKQQLFSALEKEGKRWNPDTKKFEDLPKKCEFKPFQKVLAKFDEDYCEWMPDFFYHYDKSDSEMPYVCIANGRAIECIPYNEETKHLLGTTDEWKGGE